MPNLKNISQVQNITDKLQTAQAVYLIDHQGLTANSLNQLRAKIKETDSQLVVVKNTLFAIAVKQLNKNHPCYTDSLSQIKQTSAALFANQDQIAPLKLIVNFAKTNDQRPIIKLGILNNKLLNTDEVNQLSLLPGQNQLRAQLVGLMQSPITRLVFSLKGNLSKLVIALNEIQKQKPN